MCTLPDTHVAAVAIDAIQQHPIYGPMLAESPEPTRAAADLLGWVDGADGGEWWDAVCDALDDIRAR